MLHVPEPYAPRAVGPSDIETIWRLLVAINLDESGTPGWGLAEVESWLTGESIDMGQDVVLVEDQDGSPVAVALFDAREPFVRPITLGGVMPDHRNRGLGSALVAWARRKAEACLPKAPDDAAVTLVAYTAFDHAPSTALMEGNGFTWSRLYVEMEIEFDGPPEPARPPAGVILRQFDAERELEELAVATSEGFRDHFGFVESPIDVRVRRLQHWMEASNHDPKLWWVAEADGKIVGFNICEPESEGDPNIGYVASLAVLRSHRGRGLGRALLLESFAEFHRRGMRGAALGVDADSLTGATRLYESVGMHPGVRYSEWDLGIREGAELATRALEGN